MRPDVTDKMVFLTTRDGQCEGSRKWPLDFSFWEWCSAFIIDWGKYLLTQGVYEYSISVLFGDWIGKVSRLGVWARTSL